MPPVERVADAPAAPPVPPARPEEPAEPALALPAELEAEEAEEAPPAVVVVPPFFSINRLTTRAMDSFARGHGAVT